FCPHCGSPTPDEQRGPYCKGRDCKQLAANARKNRRAQKICRLCGRGPAPFLKALRKLYRAVDHAAQGSILPPEVTAAYLELEDLRRGLKVQRDARKEEHASQSSSAVEA